ncbi:hypothetical protein B0T21DRAFT_408864 [Apiosordaria backusii]|uniref:Uncharacterized protein n=1 Tax=Apiosordaria backusii TaxID=314023 RepID=A0AA40EMF1_9PEZI|nr:hypothetical protein B0T21DRAFT_408864 [Apiosordaria backusii]
MPMLEYFDVVIAEDASIFFAITFLLQGWSLARCKQHVDKVKRTRITNGKILFGDSLQCAKSRIEAIGSVQVLLKRKDKNVYNYLKYERDSDQFPEPIVEYNGKPYSPRIIQECAAQMIANLFYINGLPSWI